LSGTVVCPKKSELQKAFGEFIWIEESLGITTAAKAAGYRHRALAHSAIGTETGGHRTRAKLVTRIE